nr:transcription factor zeb2 [Quercus suber]
MLDNFTFPAADGLSLNGGYVKSGDPVMMPHANQVPATPLTAGNFMAPLDFRLPADQHHQPLTMDMIDDSASALDHQNPPSLISTPRTPSSDAPLEERIDYVLASIKAVGFKDLNASVTAYYTDTFSDTSPLHAHQRMSRNRRLPRLIAALRASAEDWSEWERRGFCEELLWGAEDIFREECKAFGKTETMHQLQMQLAQSLPNRESHGAGAHCLQNAKRAFQEDVSDLDSSLQRPHPVVTN